jgi:hypothetical protein
MYDPVRTKSFARSRLGRSIITSLILHDTEFRAVARDMLSSLELCSQSQFPNRSVSCFLRTGMHPVRPEPRQDIVALLKSQDTSFGTKDHLDPTFLAVSAAVQCHLADA